MKIYNKSAFVFGVSCAGALLLFALGVIAVEWWQWVITIVISGRYLYIGLSKTANENAHFIRQHYRETTISLYGKYAHIKTNLPFILLAIFLLVVLFAQFFLDIVTPNSVAIIFNILLIISLLYSSHLDRNIKSTIMNEKENTQEKQ